MKPAPGETAPDFTAPVVGHFPEDGAALTLSDLRGETVVLVEKVAPARHLDLLAEALA